MGHYTNLFIGEEEISWKYYIPPFVSFLFDPKDSYVRKDDNEPEFEYFGFSTTCSAALKKLDNWGFNWDLIESFYVHFYDELYNDYMILLEEDLFDKYSKLDRKTVKRKAKQYIKKFPDIGRKTELEDFKNFILPILKASKYGEEHVVLSKDGKTYRIEPNRKLDGTTYAEYDLHLYMFRKTYVYPPWVTIIMMLFEDYLNHDFPDIVSIIYIRFLLEAHSPKETVDLDLSDIVDSPKKIENFHEISAKEVIAKVQIFNNFFNSIIEKEKELSELFLKNQLLNKLNSIKKIPESEKYKKGKALEDLVDFLLSNLVGLEVTDKKFSNGDEEIDLIIKNDIDRPFWNAFSSPLIFIECKNWNKKVGSAEIRNFEGKLRNHSTLAKIGIFISYNGFTREAFTELKRASRDKYHVAVITAIDINNYINSKISLLSWLEKMMIKVY